MTLTSSLSSQYIHRIVVVHFACLCGKTGTMRSWRIFELVRRVVVVDGAADDCETHTFLATIISIVYHRLFSTFTHIILLLVVVVVVVVAAFSFCNIFWHQHQLNIRSRNNIYNVPEQKKPEQKRTKSSWRDKQRARE